MSDYVALIHRFFDKVDTDFDSGCWNWTGARCGTNRAYGQFFLDGRRQLAHRAAWRIFIGEMPEGYDLDHLCRNPRCVNPWHIEPVPHRENVRRGWAAILAARRELLVCPSGHRLDEANIYVDPLGAARCRACRREAQKRWREANPEAAAAMARRSRQRRSAP